MIVVNFAYGGFCGLEAFVLIMPHQRLAPLEVMPLL
jgi:hypothetical protein